MVAQPFWINRQLAIVPRPRGGDWLDDEMLALRDAGIDVVVSMLEGPEAADLNLQQESAAARRAGLQFVNFAIPDRSVPADVHQFEAFLVGLEQHLASGKCVGVHCRACIGRASVTVASLLIRSGIPVVEAWHQVEIARGPVPDTHDQREWVDRNMRLIAR
jgi:protein-tyrosine phosphatase